MRSSVVEECEWLDQCHRLWHQTVVLSTNGMRESKRRTFRAHCNSKSKSTNCE